MRKAFSIALLSLAAATVYAATTVVETYAVMRGATNVQPTPKTQAECDTRADILENQLGPSAQVECRIRRIYTRTTAPPPPPINCVVSWPATFTPETCYAPATQSRTATITTQPANGGTACPALVETKVCPAAPPPTPTGGVIVCTTNITVGQAPSACPATGVKARSAIIAEDRILWCESGAANGAAQAACSRSIWQRWSYMQGYSPVLTSIGWYRRDDIPTGPITPPPPPPPPTTDGTATVRWEVPKLDTGGGTTTIAGYRLYAWLESAPQSPRMFDIKPPETPADWILQPVTGLTGGTWVFSVESYRTDGATSNRTNPVSKVIP